MITLFSHLSEETAQTYGLVLASNGIAYSISKTAGGWHVLVPRPDHERAAELIRTYLAENRPTGRPEASADREKNRTYSGIVAAMLIMACHLFTTMGASHSSLVGAWGASAAHITNGEWFRAVTALMLHAGGLHLIGNMAGLALFGTAVCMITGSGLGWLIILLSGFLGNLLNAFLFASGHVSIGASTAVFGALGILAGHQFMRKFGHPGERVKAWIPLAGGLALLGFLGSGAHTDITAHFFGFLAGLLLGAAYSLVFKNPPPVGYQTYGYLLTIGILAISLLRAL